MNKIELYSNLKRRAPEILSGVAVLGVIATTVSAISATPKAVRILEHEAVIKNRKLTPMEIVHYAGPLYFKTILFGSLTIASILGSTALSNKRYANMKDMLTASYVLLDKKFQDYRMQVIEEFGENADQKIAGGLFSKKHPKISEKVLYYEPISKQYAELEPYEIENALYEANRKFAIDGELPLNYWLRLLGLEEVAYGNIKGWNAYHLWECYEYAWIDVDYDLVVLDDGLECYRIIYPIEPDENYMLY